MTIPDLAAHGPCRAPSDQGQRISPIWQIRYLEARWGSLPLGYHGRACTSLFAYDSMTLWSCKNLWMKETSCMEASSPNAIHCACWVFKHSQTLSSNFRFCMHLNYMIWSGNATYVKHCAENCINMYICLKSESRKASEQHCFLFSSMQAPCTRYLFGAIFQKPLILRIKHRRGIYNHWEQTNTLRHVIC